MLSKLFRPRQSTNDRHAPLESRPTSGQPTTDKSPSKLVRKLKEFKKGFRSSRFNKNDGDRANEIFERIDRTSPYNESCANLGRVSFAPEDYNFGRASPIPSYHDLGSNCVSIGWSSHNGSPMTTRAAHPESNWPINPFPTPAAPAVTTFAKSSSRFYEVFLSPEEEAEVLADIAGIAVPSADRAEAEELRSRQAPPHVIPPATPTTQRSNTAVAAHQPAERHRVQATTPSAKNEKQRVEGRNKWWEMGGNLRDTKRHLRSEAVDYGNPNGPYCNVEQIAHQGHALKRGRANKRRERPQKHHSQKYRQASTVSVGDQPISSWDTAEKAAAPIDTYLFKLHKHHSKFIEMFDEPHQLIRRFNDQGNSTRDYAALLPVPTTGEPLGSLNLNVILSGGGQESHQADGIEDSEDGNDNADHVPASNPSLWFEPRIFFPSRGPDPNQL